MAKRKMMKKNKAKKVTPAPSPSITESINSEVIAAALSSVNQPVFIKVCRLCEAKDGPFLNIFDRDMITAKKIEVVMPFVIAENDDLPHKICFRCSAKVEELYEFIQKCINTQKSLRKAVGAKGPMINKPRHRELWEEKLNQSNISNDDICDALIKKAMEGIKDIPLNPIPLDENEPPVKEKPNKKPPASKDDTLRNILEKPEEKEKAEIPAKPVKVEQNKLQQEPITKSLRSNAEKKTNVSEKNPTKSDEKDVIVLDKALKSEKSNAPTETNTKKSSNKPIVQTNTFSLDETTKPEPEPAFNIMDHVSIIKVNGVGVLFQCKICNRNFLKKEVVMSHACAKNGPSKIAGPKNYVPPEPPKIPSVKYINTKEVKKPVETDNDSVQLIDLDDDDDEDDKPLVVKKSKPKIGPASKVKRNNTDTETSASTVSNTQTLSDLKTVPKVTEPVVQFPTLPSLNSRYKLVPGPNNTFTLVEEKISDNDAPSPEKVDNAPNFDSVLPNKDKSSNRQVIGPRRSGGKSQNTPTIDAAIKPPQLAAPQPYPVGLFKTLTSNTNAPIMSEPVGFTTPAMKKQSYTIVQTGNPSKLLISTKPQVQVEEVPKKRQRKARHEVKADDNQQPFSVTLEDTAPPRDPGFFTFINVDPLLQPSYVLPTNNIIQESQISTSTSVSKQGEKEKDSKYTCNMCNESFTREKKLLAHIQSHYSKMDEEDQLRAEKVPKKRRK